MHSVRGKALSLATNCVQVIQRIANGCFSHQGLVLGNKRSFAPLQSAQKAVQKERSDPSANGENKPDLPELEKSTSVKQPMRFTAKRCIKRSLADRVEGEEIVAAVVPASVKPSPNRESPYAAKKRAGNEQNHDENQQFFRAPKNLKKFAEATRRKEGSKRRRRARKRTCRASC